MTRETILLLSFLLFSEQKLLLKNLDSIRVEARRRRRQINMPSIHNPLDRPPAHRHRRILPPPPRRFHGSRNQSPPEMASRRRRGGLRPQPRPRETAPNLRLGAPNIHYTAYGHRSLLPQQRHGGRNGCLVRAVTVDLGPGMHAHREKPKRSKRIQTAPNDGIANGVETG